MYVDLSGSMHRQMEGTLEQMLNMAMFCRKVNIPFDVYGFSNNRPYRDEDFTGTASPWSDNKEVNKEEESALKNKSRDDSLEDKIEETPEIKIKTLEEKIARTLAEMENQRRRFEKEKEEAFEYGGYSFAKEALNLIDNLERSKQVLETDEKLKDTEALKKSLEHLDIIKKDTISIFEKNNIKPIESLNKKLDPNFHQAMMEIEDDTKEPGTIIQEIQKGFTIKDRLLRPSLVGVSKKVSKKEEKTEEVFCIMESSIWVPTDLGSNATLTPVPKIPLEHYSIKPRRNRCCDRNNYKTNKCKHRCR